MKRSLVQQPAVAGESARGDLFAKERQGRRAVVANREVIQHERLTPAARATSSASSVVAWIGSRRSCSLRNVASCTSRSAPAATAGSIGIASPECANRTCSKRLDHARRGRARGRRSISAAGSDANSGFNRRLRFDHAIAERGFGRAMRHAEWLRARVCRRCGCRCPASSGDPGHGKTTTRHMSAMSCRDRLDAGGTCRKNDGQRLVGGALAESPRGDQAGEPEHVIGVAVRDRRPRRAKTHSCRARARDLRRHRPATAAADARASSNTCARLKPRSVSCI